MSNEVTPWKEKNIKKMVSDYMIPRVKIIYSNIKSTVQTAINKKVTFKGGMKSTGTLDTSQELSDFKTTIDANSHKHPASSIAGSIAARANTIAQRDIAGRIYGSGMTHGNTGFKLANGKDISTLFKNRDQVPLTIQNAKEGTGNILDPNVGLDITTKTDGTTTLYLTRRLSSLCPTYRHPDVTVDGCH